MNKVRIRAWWVAPSYNPGIKIMGMRSMGQQRMHEFYADVQLELIEEAGDGSATYRVFGGSGQPLQGRGLEVAGVPARDLHNGRIMLAGDRHTLWTVARSYEDHATGDQLNWLLVRDTRSDMEPSWVDPPNTFPSPPAP